MKMLFVPLAVLVFACGATMAASTVSPNMPGDTFMQKLRHVCGVRFCGCHHHHHCHDWCDHRGRHWHCPGHD
ncbi:hypothetical protein [Verrucomicrobium spinosum]|uniref:hypothetical protein n=1 Tax=Verrucomicrobium spinosum TaxID=2736 RepID=UPI0002DA0B11|nr:hypothetical protein [Verrucomicrobium spinosum]